MLITFKLEGISKNERLLLFFYEGMRHVPHPVLPKLIKRQPYNKYEKFIDQIYAVWERLINLKRGEIQNIQEETNIPYPTLARCHQQNEKHVIQFLQRKWC